MARLAKGTPAGLTLAAKGGHNGEHHNHNDVGSVVVALNGVPVFVDAGRPTYTAQTFGPDRYEIWTMQSSWHNVPEIRDAQQATGSSHAARDVSVDIGDLGSGLTLDIAGAYAGPESRCWLRRAHLDRRDGRVRITDSWDLRADAPPARTRVHFLAAGSVHLGRGYVDITALEEAGSVRLSWVPAEAPCTATVRVLDDPVLSDVWGDRLTRLEIDVTALGPIGTIVWTLEERK
jgi:hypothetical protein